MPSWRCSVSLDVNLERVIGRAPRGLRDPCELVPPQGLPVGVNPYGLVAGVDEAGRGPLAGPVVAAAVVLDMTRPIVGLADSKKLSSRRREQLAAEITSNALAWRVASADVQEVDRLNILEASMLAMQRAVLGLSHAPSEAWVDGNRAPRLPCKVITVVKGDALHQCISAASILAKVWRDREMVSLHEHYPEYDFKRHKGYPTRVHLAALAQHGPSPCHRRSFAPVARLLEGRTG
ncbi:MAG: ribonuclease HII [Chromatiales bacterium]|jgi:ribonuclease HII|nr:ribonuclease HII [Chromatiales bacterium]